MWCMFIIAHIVCTLVPSADGGKFVPNTSQIIILFWSADFFSIVYTFLDDPCLYLNRVTVLVWTIYEHSAKQ